jgi:hypothetical protein
LFALLALGIASFAAFTAIAADKVKPSPNTEAKITETLKATFPEVVIKNMMFQNRDAS